VSYSYATLYSVDAAAEVGLVELISSAAVGVFTVENGLAGGAGFELSVPLVRMSLSFLGGEGLSGRARGALNARG